MVTYVPEEKLNNACKIAAETLGIDTEVFKRLVFEHKQKEYDRMDVKQWLKDQNYIYTEDDVDQIMETLRSDWDANQSTWGNIETAYHENHMHLSNEDDE